MTADGDCLERAWRFRQSGGWLEEDGALRVFHGPTEGLGTPLESFAVDRFADWAWVTEWEGGSTHAREGTLDRIRSFLTAQGVKGGSLLPRPEEGIADESALLFGDVPAEVIPVREGSLRFGVKLLGVRHPGLFLDHRPLRDWLRASLGERTVLNCFAYTGSLSVAAGAGGARAVTTLDLSKPSVRWAEENWRLNELPTERARFLAGDVFEQLPRFARQGERFDCVILDPPSFSRGKKGAFSTTRDLAELHRLAMACLGEDALLVTSINSANVTRAKYEADVAQAARDLGVQLEVLETIELPELFAGPRRSSERGARAGYLKGWILRVRSRSGPRSRPGRPGRRA